MLKREFSWSYTRHCTFERCHRAYYYHYYASWGGWDIYAPEKAKFLYRLKKMQTVTLWTQSIFYNSLKKAFIDQDLSRRYLLKTAIFQIRREIISMKNPSFEKNPKNRLLREIFIERKNIDLLREKAEESISGIIKKFTGNPVYERLRNVDILDVKNLPEPAYFILNGIKIWTRPDFIWTENGVLKILNLFTENPLEPKQWKFKVALDIMLAEAKFPNSRKTEVSSFFLHNKSRPAVIAPVNSEEVKSLIDKSCRNMLELTSLDTDIREELFAQADSDKCQYCNFNRACLSTISE